MSTTTTDKTKQVQQLMNRLLAIHIAIEQIDGSESEEGDFRLQQAASFVQTAWEELKDAKEAL